MYVRGCAPMWVHVATRDWLNQSLSASIHLCLGVSVNLELALPARLAGLSPWYLPVSAPQPALDLRYHTYTRLKCINCNHVTHRAISPGSRYLVGILFTGTFLLTLWDLHIYSSTLNRQCLVSNMATSCWQTPLAFLWIVLSCCAHSPTLKAHLHSHPSKGFVGQTWYAGRTRKAEERSLTLQRLGEPDMRKVHL